MSFMTGNSFDILLRETAYDLVKFSNAFWVKNRQDSIPFINATGIIQNKKCVAGYFRVDPSTMQIKFDKNGKIVKYRQVINNREKEFSIDDIIHFTFDRDPGSEWGVPRWIAALEDIRILRKAEGDILALMYRYAMPYFHAKIGLPQQGLYGTEKEIDDFKMTVERTPPDGMLITNERANIEVIGASGEMIDMNPYTNYFQDRVFTALNVSPAMMGRGDTSQNADTMEQQVHNAVKDNQASFAIQFQHFVITELLLEGGFNPILNEDDIVTFCFNEINLDTKVKTENHEINKFQSNVITLEELRDSLGYRKDSVDEERLYARMLEQRNTIEQIKLNHKNALELQTLTHENNLELAKLNQINSGENQQNNNSQNQSKSKSTKQSDKGKQYTKKNTGNGKTKTNKGKNGATKSMDQPSNQHGTFSVKIKESSFNAINEISNSITNNNIDLEQAHTKLLLVMNDAIDIATKDGWNDALKELGKEDCINNSSHIKFENPALSIFIRNNLNKYFSDIKKQFGNITDREALSNIVDKQKYRLKLLQDLVYRKSYWYSYVQAHAVCGVKELKIQCQENSRHKEHHNKTINTLNFKLSEIPGFSSNCKCFLTPLSKDGE